MRALCVSVRLSVRSVQPWSLSILSIPSVYAVGVLVSWLSDSIGVTLDGTQKILDSAGKAPGDTQRALDRALFCSILGSTRCFTLNDTQK